MERKKTQNPCNTLLLSSGMPYELSLYLGKIKPIVLVNLEGHSPLTNLVPNVVSLPPQEKLSGRIVGKRAGIPCWTPGGRCPYWGPISHRRAAEWSRNSKGRPWESFYRPRVTVSLPASQRQGGLRSSPPAIKTEDGHCKWHMICFPLALMTNTFIWLNTFVVQVEHFFSSGL